MELTRKTADEVLSSFRDRHGVTLEGVSKKTGIAVSTLIDIEKGRIKPHASTVSKLNKYLSDFK